MEKSFETYNIGTITGNVIVVVGEVNDEWASELATLHNINIGNKGRHILMLEVISYALFYLTQKVKQSSSEAEYANLMKEVDNFGVDFLAKILYTDPDNGSLGEEGQKELPVVLRTYFHQRLQLYSDYQKGSTIDLFAILLLDALNQDDETNVKFIKKGIWPKILFNLAAVLSVLGGNYQKQFGKKKFFAEKVIHDLASAIHLRLVGMSITGK